jgi:hypothetical protein
MRQNLKYRYTADWTSHNFPFWEKNLGHFRGVQTHILEIGTFEGRSAFWFVENLLTHPISEMVTIDKYLNEHFIYNFKKFPDHHKIWSILGTSDWLQTHNPGFFDLVYIDGEHSEEWVTRDIDNVLPFIVPGGFLLFDDYDDFPGVRSAVQTFLGKVHGWEIVDYGHQMLLKLGQSSAEEQAPGVVISPPGPDDSGGTVQED